jgi:hypothetical protein
VILVFRVLRTAKFMQKAPRKTANIKGIVPCNHSLRHTCGVPLWWFVKPIDNTCIQLHRLINRFVGDKNLVAAPFSN